MRQKHDRNKDYDHESLRDEREYGFYWYGGLWSILRPVLVFLTSLLIVFGIVSSVYQAIDNAFISPVDPADDTEIAFSVASGNSLTRVANNLEAQQLIKSSTFFKYYCDFAGLGQKIQAGDYLISRSMNIFEIADLLTTGDGQPLTLDITIIPGDTIEDIAEYLKDLGVITDTAEFLNICKTGEGVTDYYYVDELFQSRSVSGRKYLLEGYLAPNTYEIYTNATPLSIIRKLLTQTDKVFTSDWQLRAEELGMSMDEVLIMASMIEKEAKKADFAKVSAVFHNRLDKNMKLESDPTIHYVTGERRMSLRSSDLAVDSPYNTYRVSGLPAGAICNPSPEAINAALYPDESYVAEKYLFFCSKDPSTGELHFSRTLEEHERAAAIYAPLWQAYDAERGM
ncbi:MAG: endolytic transglycosylase MltG [Clostridia bacterium]|nr:endolytic transglycosylase MltG [Clostridia bacterium]